MKQKAVEPAASLRAEVFGATSNYVDKVILADEVGGEVDATRRLIIAAMGCPLALSACAALPIAGILSPALADHPELLKSPDGDAIVFEGTDPTNPLSIFRVPITRRLQQLALDLSRNEQDPIRAVEKFMIYIDGFSVGFASEATPDATVLESIGACGTYTGVLLALARCLGIPGRYINLHNYPKGDGHTVAELYIYERWMLFDCTTHVYYTASPNPKDLPLSYTDILSYCRAGLPIYRVGGNKRVGRDSYTGAGIFLNASPQGVIGPANPMAFPLHLNAIDRLSLRSSEFGTDTQGAAYIGAAGENIEQVWTLSGLRDKELYRFVIVPASLGGDLSGNDSSFTMMAEFVGGLSVSDVSLTRNLLVSQQVDFRFDFRACVTDVTLKITHPYRGPGFRYVSVKEYRLEPM